MVPRPIRPQTQRWGETSAAEEAGATKHISPRSWALAPGHAFLAPSCLPPEPRLTSLRFISESPGAPGPGCSCPGPALSARGPHPIPWRSSGDGFKAPFFLWGCSFPPSWPDATAAGWGCGRAEVWWGWLAGSGPGASAQLWGWCGQPLGESCP